MSTIKDLWNKSKETFDTKSLAQILSFTGDGKLRDGNSTSMEFRELLDQVPSKYIRKFSEDCLAAKFDDGGLALQDIINQVGIRLGFIVEHGLYRGRPNDIGFDGIWHSKDNYSLVIEVKTTDAYRINLNIIASYRNKLVEKGVVDKTRSSILIVVGKQDTGDLEAQIRGSQHAWDIRVISVESLIKLVETKESLNDTNTIRQINELLKPREYTRVDDLIELIFRASKDIQPEEGGEEIEPETSDVKQKTRKSKERVTPVSFHEQCVNRIETTLGEDLIKQSRSAYSSKSKGTGIICAISKQYKQGQYQKFWFAFHPHQQEFLEDFRNAYVSFGCGSPKNTLLIPYSKFKEFIKNFNQTFLDDRHYWHVVIYEKDNKFLLARQGNNYDELLDITEYKI
jgi:hypothetical protein